MAWGTKSFFGIVMQPVQKHMYTCHVYFSDLGPVHTDPGKFENASFFLWLGQPSTLNRRFRSPKTELFKKLSPKWVSFSNLPGLMWTENILRGVLKFLRFQIYPGQCGRGLSLENFVLHKKFFR